MKIDISDRVLEKLNTKHGGVTLDELRQCFANRNGEYAIDDREDHLTNPLTRWFIAETNFGRKLKICFIPLPDRVELKTAYEPSAGEIALYGKYDNDQ
jgi:hypothetical protein